MKFLILLVVIPTTLWSVTQEAKIKNSGKMPLPPNYSPSLNVNGLDQEVSPRRITLPVEWQVTKSIIQEQGAVTKTETFREDWLLEVRKNLIFLTSKKSRVAPLLQAPLSKSLSDETHIDNKSETATVVEDPKELSDIPSIYLKLDELAKLIGLDPNVIEHGRSIDHEGHDGFVTVELDRRAKGNHYKISVSDQESVSIRLSVIGDKL